MTKNLVKRLVLSAVLGMGALTSLASAEQFDGARLEPSGWRERREWREHERREAWRRHEWLAHHRWR